MKTLTQTLNEELKETSLKETLENTLSLEIKKTRDSVKIEPNESNDNENE